MNLKEEYYKEQYEELKVLSDTEKCKTVLERNVDTGELAVRKEMGKEAYKIYSVLKEIHDSHLVQVFECFETENGCTEYEEYVNGKKLASVIGEEGMPVNKAIEYCLQICGALSKVHEQGIVHRDIDPSNIVISGDDVLKLIDFDIARVEKEGNTKDTRILGTAGYAAPEQYGFAQTDGRSDIYSIGILLKEMITGKPDAGENEIREKVYAQNLNQKMKVKEDLLLGVIHTCTQMDADKRYEDVKHLAGALRRCQGGLEELPPLSFRSILRSVPGFKNGNIFFEAFAGMMYILFLSAFASTGYEQGTSVPECMILAVVFMAMFAAPFACIANIGQIVQRVTKRKLRSVKERIIFQIIYCVIALIVIGSVALVITSCF